LQLLAFQNPVLTQVAHARILYAEKLTPTSILDIVSTQVDGRYGYGYTSYVVTTDTPRSTECKVLVSFTSSFSSLGDRLETLLKSLSERLAPRMSESLYQFFMKTFLLYSANTTFLNVVKLAQQAGKDAVVIEEGYY
jgi:hypothetical protein